MAQLTLLIQESGESDEVERMAANALASLCSKAGTRMSKHYSTIFDALHTSFHKNTYSLLNSQPQLTKARDFIHPCSAEHQTNRYRTTVLQVVCSVLRVLQVVIVESRRAHEPYIGRLLPVLKRLITYGRPTLTSPICRHDSNITLLKR